MIPGNKDVLGVSLSEDTLKVVQVKGSGSSARIVNLTSQDVSGATGDALAKAVSGGLKRFKTKGSEVVCIIPPSMATTKNIEIPSTDPEEIKSIVNLQAGRHTPFSRDEIELGYVNLGIYNTSYTKVLLVIVNRKLIKDQLHTFEQAGVHIKRVVFSPEGIASFYAKSASVGGDAQPVGLIDIDKNSTDFIVLSNGLPITTRSIPIGKNQLAQGGDASDKLVDELNQTLTSYANDDIGPTPSQLLLASNDDHHQTLGANLSSKLNVNTQASPYVDIIKASKGILSKLAKEASNVSLLGMFASAAMYRDSQINLIPDEVVLQKSVESQGREVFKVAVMGVLVMVLIGTALGSKVYFKNSFYEKIKNDYKDVSSEVIALKKQSEITAVIRGYLDERMDSLDVVTELYDNLPKEIYLTSITMEDTGVISIQGVSEAGSIVYSMGSSLEQSEFFKSAEVLSTTAKKDRGKDATAFEIAIKLSSAKDDEAEE